MRFLPWFRRMWNVVLVLSDVASCFGSEIFEMVDWFEEMWHGGMAE